MVGAHLALLAQHGVQENLHVHGADININGAHHGALRGHTHPWRHILHEEHLVVGDIPAGVPGRSQSGAQQKGQNGGQLISLHFHYLPTAALWGADGRHLGVRGFEPPTSASRTRRSNQAEPHPA